MYFLSSNVNKKQGKIVLSFDKICFGIGILLRNVPCVKFRFRFALVVSIIIVSLCYYHLVHEEKQERKSINRIEFHIETIRLVLHQRWTWKYKLEFGVKFCPVFKNNMSCTTWSYFEFERECQCVSWHRPHMIIIMLLCANIKYALTWNNRISLKCHIISIAGLSNRITFLIRCFNVQEVSALWLDDRSKGHSENLNENSKLQNQKKKKTIPNQIKLFHLKWNSKSILPFCVFIRWKGIICLKQIISQIEYI